MDFQSDKIHINQYHFPLIQNAKKRTPFLPLPHKLPVLSVLLIFFETGFLLLQLAQRNPARFHVSYVHEWHFFWRHIARHIPHPAVIPIPGKERLPIVYRLQTVAMQ